MSGSADKNPQANQSVDKITSSVTEETSIVKPTKENYYEVNTRNEKIIRDKYVLLDNKYKEVQSEIQTFNKNYKQLLELNQLHKQPYFLPSFSLKNQGGATTSNNIVALRCCKCNKNTVMNAIQFNSNNKMGGVDWKAR